ncbi:HAD family hydrolase [Chitinilyticum litopenaei]|uniref:HAD family hydrolase n=1 Tax=Chitinilyticum litopenaei TaxID=1121276 RepID=UPI000420DEB7|nr:HAD family hydrolase [Chitinilyticum litopenaei]
MKNPALILFDWDDTLMVDHPEWREPMADWPAVAAVDGALDLLQTLNAAGLRCGLATSARVSTEAQIRLALARVGLAEHIEPIFCWRNTGAEKTNPQFWHKLLLREGLAAGDVVMVGDQFAADVRTPAAKGLSAVWFNPHDAIHRTGPGYTTIHALSELPTALAGLGFASG